MKIKPEISSAETESIIAENQTTQIPIVTTSEAETTVMVKDGVTIIIGGLKKEQRTKTVKKIPFVGDIPGVGFFFRNTSDNVTVTDLVILLTPHIMSGETSYTDFDEIKPEDGAVVKMAKGKIIMEKIPSGIEETEMSANEYYASVTDKINALALFKYPKAEKGKVTLTFVVNKNGLLLGEPRVVKSNNKKLSPFAIKAIKQAAPFTPFPKSVGKEKKKFKTTLVYE
jgi:Flp pilus assembly secretin CpaC